MLYILEYFDIVHTYILAHIKVAGCEQSFLGIYTSTTTTHMIGLVEAWAFSKSFTSHSVTGFYWQMTLLPRLAGLTIERNLEVHVASGGVSETGMSETGVYRFYPGFIPYPQRKVKVRSFGLDESDMSKAIEATS